MKTIFVGIKVSFFVVLCSAIICTTLYMPKATPYENNNKSFRLRKIMQFVKMMDRYGRTLRKIGVDGITRSSYFFPYDRNDGDLE